MLGTVGLGISGASVVSSIVDHDNEMALYLVDSEIRMRFKDPATQDEIEAWILKMEEEIAELEAQERNVILGVD